MNAALRPNLGKYAGRIYTVVSALPWGDGEYSVFSGASPAVANGDMSASTYTDPDAFEVDLTSTGVVVIDTLGSEARQSFYTDVYDVSLRQWYGSSLEWVNNKLPVHDNSLNSAITVQSGSAMSAVDFGATMSDADGDILTYTVVGGSLPPGVTIDAATGVITGTPS